MCGPGPRTTESVLDFALTLDGGVPSIQACVASGVHRLGLLETEVFLLDVP